MAHASHAHEHHEDHGSLSTYIAVFGALLVLTAISFAVGNWGYMKERAPGVIWAFMMAVSVAKALLVILFFMHLKWEANWKYVLTIPCCIMSVFLVLMLVPDIGRRTRYYTEERWTHATEPVAHVYENAIRSTNPTVHTADTHVEQPAH
jgi:cytochrome c oxidase subunit 4